MPGEASKAARLLKMPFKKFREKFLIVDWWIDDGDDIELFSPKKIGVDNHRTRASWGFAFAPAPCIFLKEGRCSIHAAKPYECRQSMPHEKGNSVHYREIIKEAWKKKSRFLR